jgi:hypothetical protein
LSDRRGCTSQPGRRPRRPDAANHPHQRGVGAAAHPVGGVAIAGAVPQAKPEDTSTATLRFDVQFSDFHLVDVGEPGLSLGDNVVFHDLLLSGGKRVGDQGGTCPVVDVSQGLIHCTGTIRLSGGQLTFQGLTTTAPTKQFAITGGTGRYQDVGGQGRWWSSATARAASP